MQRAFGGKGGKCDKGGRQRRKKGVKGGTGVAEWKSGIPNYTKFPDAIFHLRFIYITT